MWGWIRSLFRPQRPDHHLKERYGLEEKPPQWNRDVLGWFFRGPERRRTSEEFKSAFAERARQLGSR